MQLARNRANTALGCNIAAGISGVLLLTVGVVLLIVMFAEGAGDY